MLFIVFGGFALVSLAGGRDPLGEASTPIFGVLLVAWFISELREDPPRSSRALLWVGIVSGFLVLAGSAVNALA